jgi:hypothetical protein
MMLRNHDPEDVFKAHFATRYLTVAIKNAAEQCILEALSQIDYLALTTNPHSVSEGVIGALQEIVGVWGIEVISVGFVSVRATPRTEMLTQLPTIVEVLRKARLEDLEGREALVAGLAGSLTSIVAAQPSHEQQPEEDEIGKHPDVHEARLGVVHGLPPEGRG